MKVKLAILAGLIIVGGVAANIINGFKRSPTVQVIQQLQEKKDKILKKENNILNNLRR